MEVITFEGHKVYVSTIKYEFYYLSSGNLLDYYLKIEKMSVWCEQQFNADSWKIIQNPQSSGNVITRFFFYKLEDYVLFNMVWE